MTREQVKASLKERLPLFCFIIVYLVFAFMTFRSFGITWDEARVYGRGDDLITHVTKGYPAADLVRGTLYPGYLLYDGVYAAANTVITRTLFHTDDFVYRHLTNMLLGIITFVSMFELLLFATKKKYVALLGTVLLFMTPVFLGHLAFNPKDMPYAMFFILATMLIIRGETIANTSLRNITLGIAIGLVVSQRVLGAQLLPIYFAFRLYSEYADTGKITWARIVSAFYDTLNIAMVALLTTMMSWPFLASNPLRSGYAILQANSRFPWNGTVLFFGQQIHGKDLAWYYLPAMLLIQLPLFILLPLAAIPFAMKRLWQNKTAVLVGGIILANLLLYLLIDPVIYDGMRHYLFLIPLFVVLVTLVIQEAYRLLIATWNKQTLFKKVTVQQPLVIFFVILVASFVGTVITIGMLHPYEYVYYNSLVGGLPGASGKFETDYWQAGYKEATEWLVKNEVATRTDKKVVKVFMSGSSYPARAFFDPSRMKFTSTFTEADYYISFTRSDSHLLVDQKTLIHSVQRFGVPLVNVYRLK